MAISLNPPGVRFIPGGSFPAIRVTAIPTTFPQPRPAESPRAVLGLNSATFPKPAALPVAPKLPPAKPVETFQLPSAAVKAGAPAVAPKTLTSQAKANIVTAAKLTGTKPAPTETVTAPAAKPVSASTATSWLKWVVIGVALFFAWPWVRKAF